MTANDESPQTAMPPRDHQAEQDYAEWRGWKEAQGYDWDDDSYQAEAFAAGMEAQRNLDAAQPAPDLGAAYADLESEIRNAVSLHCTGPGVPCDLCQRETGRAMKAIDAYARDVAQHERARGQPAYAAGLDGDERRLLGVLGQRMANDPTR